MDIRLTLEAHLVTITVATEVLLLMLPTLEELVSMDLADARAECL